MLALERGEPVVAKQRLQRARELYAAETVPAIWYWAAARSTAEAEDPETAASIAREGVERYPADSVLRNTLAVLLEATGDVAEAEAQLLEALAEDAGLPQVSKNLGDLCYRSGRYEEATGHYARAAALAPDLGDDLYFKLGNLAFRDRDLPRAKECWQRALDLNPAHQLARANLASLPVGR